MKTQGIDNPVSQRLNKRLYSIKEASIYLGRSIWAVREMLWAGKMPYVKDGRRILLDINDMNIWKDIDVDNIYFLSLASSVL